MSSAGVELESLLTCGRSLAAIFCGPAVHSAASGADFVVTLPLDANPKQTGQLNREWYSIMDVIEVAPASGQNPEAGWAAPHPPATAGIGPVQALA